MDTEKLKEKMRIAQESTADVKDPDLRKIAFETVLKKLLGTEKEPKANKSSETVKRASPGGLGKRTSENDPGIERSTEKLLTSINRTKYPLIYNLPKAIDKSLYILKIARDEMDIDGLIPSQIASVLKNNFRIKITPNAVSMALMGANMYVDRKPLTIKGGRGFKYYLMHEGEKYIGKLDSELGPSKEE